MSDAIWDEAVAESRKNLADELKQAHDDLDALYVPRDQGGLELSLSGRILLLKASDDVARLAERAALTSIAGSWEAEDARVKALGDLFTALPEGPHKAALLAAMTDRIIDLYNETKHEQGDAILEFLPNGYARAFLDWYFEESGSDTFTAPPEFAPQPDVIFEVFEVAQDLVALWDSPKIQGLARADRNEAIDATRSRLKEAVYVAQDIQRSTRDQHGSSAGLAGQSERAQTEAPPDAGAAEATIEGKTSTDQEAPGTEDRSAPETCRQG